MSRVVKTQGIECPIIREGAKYIILRYINRQKRYNTVSKKYIPVSI